MEDFKTWPPNIDNRDPALLLDSPSISSSSNATSQEETRSTPTLCEDHSSSSFSSLDSKTISNPCIIDINNNSNPSVIISHLLTVSIETRNRQISCLAVKDDALYAATVGEISVFDLRTLSPTGTFGPGSGLAKSIAFSGNRIFTAHQDRKIRVWEKVVTSSPDKPKHKLISTLPTCRDRVSKCFLPKNYVRTRRHVRRLWIEHADAVSGIAAADDDSGLVYSVSWDKCFKIWKVHPSGTRCLESVEAHSDAVNAVVVCPSDRTVYTGSADGEIKIWATSPGDTKTRHELVATLREHESSVNAMALTGNGPGFCSGGGDGVILVWERDENSDDFFVGGCLRGHKGAVLCLVHVNGVLISGSSDRSVRVWGLGGCLGILEGHRKPVKSLVAIPDDDSSDGCVSVFSGSMDGEIRAWKVSVSDQAEVV